MTRLISWRRSCRRPAQPLAARHLLVWNQVRALQRVEIAHTLCAFAVEELSRLNTLPSAASGEAIDEAASHEATLCDGQAGTTGVADMPHMEVSCCFNSAGHLQGV